MRTISYALAILVSVAAIAGPARAQDDPEALIRQGNEMRRRGDNARAYGYIKRAYDLSHTPRAAAQLGLIELSIGKLLESEHHLSDALAADDPWIDQNRPALDDSRRKARAKLARLELRGAPAGATLEIGDGAPTPLPPDGAVWVTPGETKVRVAAAGREAFVKQFTADAGSSTTIDVDMPALASAAPASAPPPPSVTGAPSAPPASVVAASSGTDTGATKRIAGLATAGVGAAVGIAGFFVYRAGANKVDAINAAAAGGGYYNPSDGNWQTLGDAGIAMMIGGGVAVAGGALLYLWGRGDGGAKADSEPPHAALGYLPGHGAALQLSGSF